MITLHNIDFHMDQQAGIKEYLVNKGITFSQKGIHFGNACLINIPDDLIGEIKSRFPVQYRNKKTILEASDILAYKEGEKVTIEHLETDFFPVRNAKGTVYKAEDGRLTVRAYRAQNKGWRIRAGEYCRIRRGW